MTRLKVVDSQTNRTYYLNNVDISCAKQYSFIGETDNRDTIVHKPLSHLQYSLVNSYMTSVEDLNALYNHDLSADFSGYFPKSHGIILSELLLKSPYTDDDLIYNTDKIHCEDLSLTTTTYWCPPIINRRSTLQSSRITSFSYIHKDWYNTLFLDQNNIFMVYNNTKLSNVNSNHIFGLFPSNAASQSCTPKQYCASGAIGVCSSDQYNDNCCNQSCIPDSAWPPCKNYKDLYNNNNKTKDLYNKDLCNNTITSDKHGDHVVKQGEYCGKIAVIECGTGTQCNSFSKCPAICNAATVCQNLQVGDDVKYDCTLTGKWCGAGPTPQPPAPTPKPGPAPISKVNNELIIKSWNYNPKSSMSGRGVIYNASIDKTIAQTPNPESPWGWKDVSNLYKNENIPLLAFGITIQDKSKPTKDDILNIKHYYADLSKNLEPSFNEYRRNLNPPIPLMPYRIGLDLSCLTRQECSNPFFDLSHILHLKS